MYKKILVMVKARKGAKKTIQTAFQIAQQFNASVHMITIQVEGSEEVDTRSIRGMEDAVKSAEFKNIPEVTNEVLHIKSDEIIAEKVAEMAADFDMIVMGHCKYKKIYKFLRDSVAEDLICISPCPVTIVSIECEMPR